jgi:hypothetical protein
MNIKVDGQLGAWLKKIQNQGPICKRHTRLKGLKSTKSGGKLKKIKDHDQSRINLYKSETKD